MNSLLWLIPVLPLAGFLINGLAGNRLPKKTVGAIACLLPAGSFALSVCAFLKVREGAVLTQTISSWIEAGGISLDLTFRVDALGGIMILIVSGVGSLIHLYSIGYMHDDRSVARYFAYLNLFTFAMLLLVMAGNLAVLFIGWEGVGLCSYLLIGFWYENPHNADAGKKAFLVNRIGDLGFLLGMFVLLAAFGSLDVRALSEAVARGTTVSTGLFAGWETGSICELAALLLFVGACGKSAQIPLYVWLPDAMAGPTPVSALIHAATMVTAGVYMIGRLHFVYDLAPGAREVVGLVAGATALFAAVIAVAQNDIKKVLAYSTVSQLGYMFAGMATGSYATGVFHLTTHAFFKALLFLGAGAVIHLLGGEQDMRKMGGLASKNRLLFVVFGVGGLALAGLWPLSGFHSKDAILAAVNSVGGFSGSGVWMTVWGCLVLGAFLTAFYMTRLILVVFFGPARETHGNHGHAPGWSMMVPLVILAVLSALGGGLPVDSLLEGVWGSHPHPAAEIHHRNVLISQIACGAGLGLGLLLYGLRKGWLARLFEASGEARGLRSIVQNRFYVDELYDYLVVMPLQMGATLLWFVVDRILIDAILVHGTGRVVLWGARAGRRIHSGSLSVGTAGILLGATAALGYLAWRLCGHG